MDQLQLEYQLVWIHTVSVEVSGFGLLEIKLTFQYSCLFVFTHCCSLCFIFVLVVVIKEMKQ